MDFNDKQKSVLRATVEMLWKKGAHHPQEAAIAFEFTQLVEQIVKEEPKPEEKKK